MNKIFQIGLNKCGTLSIHKLFEYYSVPRIKSVHWDRGYLAYRILDNIKNNLPALYRYENFTVFSDMETCVYDGISSKYFFMYEYFDLLDKQYPNSKFILNTRNIDNWISSRLKHKTGWRININKPEKLDQEKIFYYVSHMEMYNINSIPNLIDIWIKQREEHHSRVLDYFKHRENDLLIYDIEKDSFSKIVDFFKPCGITFNTDVLPHANKTQEST